MKIYLVTGAAGFIGANYLKYILNLYKNINVLILDDLTYAGNLSTIKENLEDERVTFIKGNIKDNNLVYDIFNKYNIDYVINFAAESHVDRSIENPQAFLKTNIIGTQNLLENAKKAWKLKEDNDGYPIYKDNVKFVQISTDEVYGSLTRDFEEPKTLEIFKKIYDRIPKNRSIKVYGNNLFTERTPLNPRSPYSASKASSDFITLAYAKTYKLPVNITRCSNNYGPYHFPEKLIPLMIKNILEGKKLLIYGNGKNIRDWLYVEDHCKAIEIVLKKGKSGEVYNIGGFNEEENISIAKLLIDIIKEFVVKESKYRKTLKTDINNINYNLITHIQDRLGHDERYAIDPTKLIRELGWFPEINFEDGIRKTIIWYLENQSWVEEVLSDEL